MTDTTEINKEYPKNFATYPQNVKDIIEKDILKREEGDPVRIAYDIAIKMHDGYTRKGIEKLDYITHSLQVYDLVKRCIANNSISVSKKDREIILAASILHDSVEDYKKKERESGEISPILAALEAEDILHDGFYFNVNLDYWDDWNRGKNIKNVINLVFELTNKLEFLDDKGNKISKIEWQVDHIAKASDAAKLIKICDKTMSSVSNIEEVPKWNYKKLTTNIKESREVVDAAQIDVKNPAITYAAKIFNMVASASENILDSMKKDKMKIPPKHPIASFSLKIIEEMIRTGNDKPLQASR